MDLKQAKELVRSRLSDKRYEHTINVKKMAVKLAKHYGTDPEQAALAALLHDAAKELPKDEMRAIMQAHPEYAQGGEARPTPVWHGICAAILARTEWGVTDEAVLSAIACHTAGKAGMTQLDKNNAELGSDYVFVNGHESSVTVSVEIYDRDGTLLSRSQPISVPLVRNKVTIVRGKFLTVKAEGGVSIDADFDGEYNYEYR